MIHFWKSIVYLTIFCFCISCGSNTSNRLKPITDGEGEAFSEGYIDEDTSYEEEWEEASSEAETDEEPWPDANPDVVQASLNGLQLIDNPWEQTILFEDTMVNFYLVVPTSANTFVAIGANDSDPDNYTSDFYFYELDVNGNVLFKDMLYSADYGCISSRNLQEFNGLIHYFAKDEDEKEMTYNLATKERIKAQDNKLDWDVINDWRKEQLYQSPDGLKTIELSATNLTLTTKTETLEYIRQLYDGTWSFGSGTWNVASTKFYFDNSGAVACIWEIDLENKTLNKVVPEHSASHPVWFMENGKGSVVYCEESYIKIVRE